MYSRVIAPYEQDAEFQRLQLLCCNALFIQRHSLHSYHCSYSTHDEATLAYVEADVIIVIK